MEKDDEEAKAQIDAAHRAEREKRDAELMRQVAAEREEIPTNDEIIAAIPSKAVRKYLRKIGHEFSERDRLLLRRYLAPKNNEEFETLYEMGRYVSVPHPFRRGDIVAVYDYLSMFTPKPHFDADGKPSENYSLGIMRSFANDAGWKESDAHLRRLDFTDFSDVATTVEFLQDDGSFSHEHPNPMQLEFARDIPDALPADSLRTTLLEVASELLRGRGSIELYEMYKKSYAASAEHLLELLEKLHGHLREYAKDFDDFRKLYFPSDSGGMQKLSAEQKKGAQEIIWSMSVAVWRIKNSTDDLALPFAALTDTKKRGTFYKEISDGQKAAARTTLNLIFEEAEHILLRIDRFTKLPDSPRKQFYQKKAEKCVKRLKRLAAKTEEVR